MVKTADGGHSAASVHPSVAADRVREGAERAVRRAASGEMRPLQIGPPVVVEIISRWASSPTTPRSCPGRSGSGIEPSASRPTTP